MATIHTTLFSQIIDWAKTAAPRSPSSLFLYGPPGIGKTTLARLALEQAGYRVVEWNASQHRHKAAVEESLIPLLRSCNVADFFRPEGPRHLGIILDEIDGMSVGDKGGLSELVRILKEYSGHNAIICISNEWMEKKFQPFMKLCQAFQIQEPSPADVYALIKSQFSVVPKQCDLMKLATDLLAVHSGDLRKILQSVREIKHDMIAGTLSVGNVRQTIEDGLADAKALGSNRIRRSETIKSAVGQLLRGSLDMTTDVPLNNNDLNLAGLHLHESLPTWIRRFVGNNEKGYEVYKSVFQTILASDRLDYYTFFFQHWTLFPLTYQAKLQAVNQLLFGHYGISDTAASVWKDDDMEYTAVLSKQSMLYNQFRYLCEMRDGFMRADSLFDGGFDSTFWKANVFIVAARLELAKKTCPGYGKKVGHPVWENTEFWRGMLPRWFPSGEPNRFMRLVQAMNIPSPLPFPTKFDVKKNQPVDLEP
jgi:ATPase family associated with various cellular activities (AAA)